MEELDKLTIDIHNLKDEYEITSNTLLEIKGVLKKSDEISKRIVIVHNIKNLKSRINIKVVTFNNSKLDLEVVLRINKGAKNCDTYLKIDCLVVGESSMARVIPSLEILENEVKGGHGATIGYLDSNQLNYLYTKGLDKLQAEKLLVDAFLS